MNTEFNKTYTYNLFFRLLYSYGNLMVTAILLLYLIPLLGGMTGRMFEYFYAAVLVFLILMFNYWFLRIWKTMPFTITVNDGVITGSDYFFSKKTVAIRVGEIVKLHGGVFDGKTRGMMRVITNDKEIAFFHSIGEGRNLLAYILSQVPRELYDAVLGRLGQKKKDLK
ncbi:MAG: hypothetical protein IT279_07725 [Ignavibacteriaceae bacterium]|nr:hypothetical protein [Ignavibacteriaceae bacterium]